MAKVLRLEEIPESISVTIGDTVGVSEEAAKPDTGASTVFQDAPIEALQEEPPDTGREIQIIWMNIDEWDSLMQDWKAAQEDTGSNFLISAARGYAIDQFERLKGMSDEELERSFLSTFQKNLPTMMFLLLPVVALILKIIYPLSKRFYIEHLIFSLHFHSFVFLVMIPPLLINRASVYSALPFVILIYLFQAMRTVYWQSFLHTLGKLLLLVFLYWFSMVIVFTVTVMLTFIVL